MQSKYPQRNQLSMQTQAQYFEISRGIIIAYVFCCTNFFRTENLEERISNTAHNVSEKRAMSESRD